jgi:hypothetical protein
MSRFGGSGVSNQQQCVPRARFRVMNVTNNRKGDRHRPDYVAPKRAGKRSISAFLDDEQFNAAHEIARRRRMTVTDMARVAIEQFINRAERRHRSATLDC